MRQQGLQELELGRLHLPAASKVATFPSPAAGDDTLVRSWPLFAGGISRLGDVVGSWLGPNGIQREVLRRYEITVPVENAARDAIANCPEQAIREID